MTPANKAKSYGASSLTAVSQFCGYNMNTMRRYAKEKPERFKALCVACVCDELGLTGQELRDYSKLKQTIEGKQMKAITMLAVLMLSTGCAVNSAKWQDAQELCAPFGGVKEVAAQINVALCNHGVYVQRAR